MTTSLVDKAIAFATKAHTGQTRNNGQTPYVTHPIKVMELLKQFTLDEIILISAIGHDLYEDTDVNYYDVEKEFGVAVADLIGEVTNTWDDQIKWEDKALLTYRHVQHMSYGAYLIKMADRICNLNEMDTWTAYRKIRYLANSLFILAALPLEGDCGGPFDQLKSLLRDTINIKIQSEINTMDQNHV